MVLRSLRRALSPRRAVWRPAVSGMCCSRILDIADLSRARRSDLAADSPASNSSDNRSRINRPGSRAREGRAVAVAAPSGI
jgi:hypothetical protein